MDSGSTKRNAVAEWAVTFLLLLFGTTTLAQAFVIPTGSMQDTLLVGDHLLVDKLTFAPAGPIARRLLPYQDPKHGDIIVFRYPADISQTLVKRLIGEPGDRIRVEQGVVFRNGVRLNEPYVYHKYGGAVLDNFPTQCCRPAKEALAQQAQQDMLNHSTKNGEVIVPAGCYFAMGDNRDNSSDSRFWGFVPRANIVGKPFLIYWSYRASTEDLMGESTDSVVGHFLDVGQHFLTRTRWSRTLRLIRSVPYSELSSNPLPLNRGEANP